MPGDFDLQQDSSSLEAVAGHAAVSGYFDGGTVASVIWSPEPDITVRLSVFGTKSEVLELAATVHPVDAAFIEDMARLIDPLDGCPGLVW